MAEGDGPTLYTNKPRKEQLKKAKLSKTSSSCPSAGMGSHSSATATTPPPPPPSPSPSPPKEPFVRRYKFVWPMLLAVNLAVGAYLFMRTKKKDTGAEEEPGTTSASTKQATVHVTETAVLPAVPKPVIREPIAENQQRELFKWMLEEKRKVKPKDPEEKRRIDEEKAVLKQFIRAKSIPNI